MTYVPLPDIPNQEGVERFGQIQKVVFQRRLKEDGTPNSDDDLNLKATWDLLLAATDATKVAPTPFIMEPENEPGELREYGGGNATLNGIPIVLGREPSQFTCALKEISQDIVKELKKMEGDDLVVYLVNANGEIGCLKYGGDDYRGIPIRSFFVSDKSFGGFEEVDRNNISFYFAPNWSDRFVVIEPAAEFDPLTDLRHSE